MSSAQLSLVKHIPCLLPSARVKSVRLLQDFGASSAGGGFICHRLTGPLPSRIGCDSRTIKTPTHHLAPKSTVTSLDPTCWVYHDPSYRCKQVGQLPVGSQTTRIDTNIAPVASSTKLLRSQLFAYRRRRHKLP